MNGALRANVQLAVYFDGRPAPEQLLLPAVKGVPLGHFLAVRRGGERVDLVDWLPSQPAVRFAVLAGPQGAGKTHVSLWLKRLLRLDGAIVEGWAGDGWLPEGWLAETNNPTWRVPA